MARAACSESTGSRRSGSPFTRSITSSPPTTSDSLLASATVFPAWRAASVGARPADPTRPFRTKSASVFAAMISAASGPTITSTPFTCPSLALTSAAAFSSAMAMKGGRNSRVWPTRSSWFIPAADSPTILNRSGCRRTTSSAWVPMDPVEPRMVIDRMATSLLRGRPNATNRTLREDHAEEQEGGRSNEQERVDPVEDPAVTREHRSHVLHADIPLHDGLGEIAQRGRDRHHQAEQQCIDPPVLERAHERCDEGARRHDGRERATQQAFPRLLRTHVRSERALEPAAAGDRSDQEGGGVEQEREQDDREYEG